MYAGPAPNRREVLKIMYVRQRSGWDEPIQRERSEDLSHLMSE
jgi:hypothetical protein